MNHFLRNSFKAIFFAAALSLVGEAVGQARMPMTNTQCPVMKGERAKDKFFVDYEGQRIRLCCKSCIKRFSKNPEKYLAELNA